MSKALKAVITIIMLAAITSASASSALAVYAVPQGGAICQNDPAGPVKATTAASVPTLYASAADYTVSDYESLVRTVLLQYLDRNTVFTVRYNARWSGVDTDVQKMMADVFTYDDPATTSDMDYLYWNTERWECSWYIYPAVTGTYTIYTFAQIYRTSVGEEDFVDAAVPDILEELNVDTAGAYIKTKAVHDYILSHVDYDNTLKKYTAFDALSSGRAVCQGYALLTYKMLAELRVPVRFISGEGGGGPHAWNIVKVGQSWFNYDVTWDDTSGQPTRWFLRNSAAFTDHIRSDEYKTDAFNTQHPMSPVDYSSLRQVQAVAFPESGGTYHMGDTFTLEAAVAPENAAVKALVWSSSNEGVAAVDEAGAVTVLTAGTAVITAMAADGSEVTADFVITALEADVPSPWAREDIEALIARGVVPEALTAGYKDAITRGEFTALIVNVYEYAKGRYMLQSQTPFTDLGDSDYALPISKAYELAIISGTSTTTFSPESTLTREQCAKIISAAAGAVGGRPVTAEAVLPFPDAGEIHSWALEYVRYVFENGLMTGTGINFEPQAVLPREQAMVIAERMIEKYGW